jgi:tol-pal system protein YbgF
VPPDGQSIYDQGYTLYHQGRYVDAESSFQRFLQAYGSTELGDNAQFWIGESRFARQDYHGALAAFQEVVDRFRAGNKVGDALLKTGDCLARLGDGAAAAQRYRQVTERFPGSAAAAMAEERLAGSPD